MCGKFIAFCRVLLYNDGMELNADLKNCENKRVCVALSGGGDSMALLHWLCGAAAANGIKLSAVNVEHGIRGESSRADSEFVKSVCDRMRVPLFSYSADVPSLAKEWGMGTEDAARRVRYRLFLRILQEDKADVIVTAHHAGDNAESVLFNLFRGSALAGAGGIRDFIPAKELAERFMPEIAAEQVLDSKGIARPFLGVSKGKILEYLRENGLSWREDETNSDTAYTRNFLRHEILGRIKERFANAEEALYRFSCMAREDDAYLYSLTDEYYTEGEVCTIDESAPKPLFYRCALRALKHFGVEKDYTQANLDDMYALSQGRNGARADLPQGVCAVREYGKIAVFLAKEPCYGGEYIFSEGEFTFGDMLAKVQRGGKIGDGEKKGRYKNLTIDAEKLPQNCVLRLRKEGDVFQKFGSGTKKLKEFLIDKKIPKRERDQLPVLASGKEIYAVFGVEISEKCKLDENSGQIYTLSLYEKGEKDKCIRT